MKTRCVECGRSFDMFDDDEAAEFYFGHDCQEFQMKLELTARELEVVRQALRGAEEAHKRADFKALVIETSNLRSKISSAMIDQYQATSLDTIRTNLNQLSV